MRVTAILFILIGLAWGTPPGSALLSLPSAAEGRLSAAHSNWQDPIQESDSVADSSLISLRARFPGKAMLMSLVIPGAGQLYARRPLKTVGFLAAEVAAVMLYRNYNRRGLADVEAYKRFADIHWDFRDWVLRAPLFGAGWEEINISLDGTHNLDFYVDMDGDGWPEIIGATSEDGDRLIQLLSHPDTSMFLFVRKNDEYYENIGKYNQFFSGWDDSDPFNPRIDDTKSGPIARSPHRNKYLDKRDRSNQLRRTAGYAISALMFNHVLSAVDAIFSTAQWNRQRGLELRGSLRFDPDQNLGVGGVTFSVMW